MKNNNSNYSPESKYLLNFSFFQKRLSSKDIGFGLSNQFNSNSMSSNIIYETSLEENYILLKKKSLIKRKSMGSIKIFYSEIIDLKLHKSGLSTLYSSIEIVFSKNGYSKILIVLSSSDSFAVRWFYDELVVRHSLFKSNLNEKRFYTGEKEFINSENGSCGVEKESLGNEDESLVVENEDENNEEDLIKDNKNNTNNKTNKNNITNKSNKSRESTLDDFMNQMNAEISEKRKREIDKQMKFDRCSSGEY